MGDWFLNAGPVVNSATTNDAHRHTSNKLPDHQGQATPKESASHPPAPALFHAKHFYIWFGDCWWLTKPIACEQTHLCLFSLPVNMPANRSAGRDVHIYKPGDLTEPLGGLVLTNGFTNANFYAMIEVFMIFLEAIFLRREDVTDGLRDIPRDEQALQPGNSYIIAEGKRLSCIHGEAFVEL